MVTVEEHSLVAAFANFSIADSAPPAASDGAPQPPSDAAVKEERVAPAPPSPATASSREDRVFASPLARRLLRESGKTVRRGTSCRSTY